MNVFFKYDDEPAGVVINEWGEIEMVCEENPCYPTPPLDLALFTDPVAPPESGASDK